MKTMLNRIGALALAVATASATATPSIAATQGTLGATSTGSITITANIPSLVRILNLDDINLGNFAGAALSAGDDVCIFSNTGGYDVTATGDGAGGAFQLTGASSGDTLAFTVQWATTAGAGSGTALSPGVALTGLGGTFTNPTCQGGASLNARVMIYVTADDLGAVSSDSYSGTLTLLIEPQ